MRCKPSLTPHPYINQPTNQRTQGSLRALAIAIGVATGVAGVGFGQAYQLDTIALQALAGIGFLGGYFAAMTVLAALDAAWAAVVLQGIVAPEALKTSHPKVAATLSGVWAKEGVKMGPQVRRVKWPKEGKKEAGAKDVEAP